MGTGKKDKSKLLHRLLTYRHLLRKPPEGGRFLVWSQSRCGTTLLTQLLDSHPEIDCEKELLARWVPWQQAYVESRRRVHPSQVFGFKVFVHHLIDDQRIQPRRFLDDLHHRGYQIVYLKRENILRHSLSQCLRKATGVTHSTSGQVVRERYRIDVDYLLRHMKVRDRMWQEAEHALEGKSFYRLTYEDDLQDGSRHQATVDGIFSFLGLDSAPVHSELKRINDKCLSDLIENYDELAQTLSGTKYEMWLEEPASVAVRN